MKLEDLNSRIFAACLHTQFRVDVPQRAPLPVELVEVTERHDSPRLEQFSIVFHGPLANWLQQGIYSLEHEKLGQFDLFLVPIGPDGSSMRYEAVFNRICREDNQPA